MKTKSWKCTKRTIEVYLEVTRDIEPGTLQCSWFVDERRGEFDLLHWIKVVDIVIQCRFCYSHFVRWIRRTLSLGFETRPTRCRSWTNYSSVLSLFPFGETADNYRVAATLGGMPSPKTNMAFVYWMMALELRQPHNMHVWDQTNILSWFVQ